MATVQQLMSALRKADAAGNTADANRLAQLVRQAITPVDRSFSSAFQSGIDAPLENMATTAMAVGKSGLADTLSNLTDAPVNYESASNRFINPEEGDSQLFGFGIDYLPRAFVEQLGQYGGSLATRVAGAGIGTAVAGPGGGVAGGLAAPALFEFVQQLGPIALERAKNDNREDPNWDDWSYAAGSAGLSGALNALGVKSGSLLTNILREGVTEGSQSVVTQTGESIDTKAGLNINPKEAVGEGILGGTTAGGVQTGIATATAPIKVTRAAVNLVSGGNNAPKDTEAAADFSRDLQAVADEAGHDLNDVNPSTVGGAKTAIDDVHADYGEQMKSLATILREKLNYKDNDEQAVRLDKVIAKTALRKGRNKAKNFVSGKDFAAVRKLAGDLDEGQQLINLLRKSNELTRVNDAGLKGGVSKFTDIFNPLDTANQGYSAPRNLAGAMSTMAGGAAALNTGGLSLIPQAALVGAGRGIDAMTGRRSKVAKFIADNQNAPGIANQNLPSQLDLNRQAEQSEVLRKAQEKQAKLARNRALNIEALRANDPPKGDPTDPRPSAQYVMETQLGLDRSGTGKVLKVVAKTRPQLKEAVKSYQTMLRDGTQVKDINKLISAAKNVSKKLGNELPQNVAQNAQAPAQADTKRQSGIDGNNERIRILRDDLANDKDVTATDKRLINRALDLFSINLGQDPVGAAEAILAESEGRASNPEKIRQYLLPYVERVRLQQKKPLSNQT